MAVKRAGALLCDPKLEDEGSESTNQHEGQRKDDMTERVKCYTQVSITRCQIAYSC